MRYALLGLFAVALVGVGLWLVLKPQAKISEGTPTPTPALAPEVESVLADKTTLLLMLAEVSGIQAAVSAANQKNAVLSAADIERLDSEWRASEGVTPFISQFITNPTAERLRAFQTEHPEFKEIFIADARGLNMAQTDKTSDFYQADEQWWIDSFASGGGKILHSEIEFDESSQTEAISIYVPILSGGRAIGVMKGVVDIAAISGAL